MVGTIIGFCLAFGQLSAAWSPRDENQNLFEGSFAYGLGFIAISTLFGIFLFPRTIGFIFTPVIFTTPIAFILGWVKNEFAHGAKIALLGVACWLATFLIAKVRPEAT